MFSIVQVVPAVSNGGSNASTMTVSITGVQPGNAIMIFAPAYGPNTAANVTCSGFVATNYLVPDGSGGTTGAGNILVKTNAAGGDYTFTLNVVAYNYIRATVVEVTGLLDQALDLTFGVVGTPSNGILTASTTSQTAQNDEVIVGLVAMFNSGNYPTTQTGSNVIYIDNTSGPSSSGVYSVLKTIQAPSLSVQTNNSGNGVALMCVTLKIKSSNIPVNSVSKKSTSLVGTSALKTTATAKSTSIRQSVSHILLSGQFNASLFSAKSLYSVFAEKFVNATLSQAYTASARPSALSNSNSVDSVKRLVCLNGAWSSATVSLNCAAGDTLIVCTFNQNFNVSGTYYPSSNRGVLQVIQDQQSVAVGTSTPVYAQMFAIFGTTSNTYTITPPNEGTNGNGILVVMCVKGIIGLRQATNSRSLTSQNNLQITANSQNKDFVVSLGYVFKTAGNNVVQAAPGFVDADHYVSPNFSSSVDYAVGSANQVSTFNWQNGSTVSGAVSAAFVSSVSGIYQATSFSQRLALATMLPATLNTAYLMAGKQVGAATSSLQVLSASLNSLRVNTGSFLQSLYLQSTANTLRFSTGNASNAVGVHAFLRQSKQTVASYGVELQSYSGAIGFSRATVAGKFVAYLNKKQSVQLIPLTGLTASITKQTFNSGTFGQLISGKSFAATKSLSNIVNAAHSSMVSLRNSLNTLSTLNTARLGRNSAFSATFYTGLKASGLKSSRTTGIYVFGLSALSSSYYKTRGLIHYGVYSRVESRTETNAHFGLAITAHNQQRYVLNPQYLFGVSSVSASSTKASALATTDIQATANAASARFLRLVVNSSADIVAKIVSGYHSTGSATNAATGTMFQHRQFSGVLVNAAFGKLMQSTMTLASIDEFMRFNGTAHSAKMSYSLPSWSISSQAVMQQKRAAGLQLNLLQIMTGQSTKRATVFANAQIAFPLYMHSVSSRGLQASMLQALTSHSLSVRNSSASNSGSWSPLATIQKGQNLKGIGKVQVPFTASLSSANVIKTIPSVIEPWKNLSSTGAFYVEVETRVFCIQVEVD